MLKPAEEFLQKIQDPQTYTPLGVLVPKDRVIVDQSPGYIRYASKEGTFQGCRAVKFGHGSVIDGLVGSEREEFVEELKLRFPSDHPNASPNCTPSDQLNLFFLMHGNIMLVSCTPTINDELCCIITSWYSNEELKDQQDDMEDWHEFAHKRKQERAAIKKKEADAKEKMEAEAEAFQKLGKVAHDQGWKEQLDKLKERVRELERKLHASGT